MIPTLKQKGFWDETSGMRQVSGHMVYALYSPHDWQEVRFVSGRLSEKV